MELGIQKPNEYELNTRYYVNCSNNTEEELKNIVNNIKDESLRNLINNFIEESKNKLVDKKQEFVDYIENGNLKKAKVKYEDEEFNYYNYNKFYSRIL